MPEMGGHLLALVHFSTEYLQPTTGLESFRTIIAAGMPFVHGLFSSTPDLSIEFQRLMRASGQEALQSTRDEGGMCAK